MSNKTPDVFIAKPISAVINDESSTGFDPVSGLGKAAKDYLRQNPITLEHGRTRTRDYAVSVVNTGRGSYNILYHNNMVSPVHDTPNIDHTLLSKRLPTNGKVGVYIIERFKIGALSNRRAKDLFEYYKYAEGLAYDVEVVDAIRSLVAGRKSNRSGFLDTEIRVVTFVPQDKLVRNQYTYVTGPGIVIVHGSVPDNLLHPYSPGYLEDTLLSTAKEDGSMSVDITIIDPDNKPYYCMVAEETLCVRPVRSKTTEVLPTGGSTVIRRNGEIVSEKFFGLEEFEDNGFYRSVELCETNGNKSLLVDEGKYKTEIAKLSAANEKLRLEAVSRRQTYEFDKAKRRDEYGYTKAVRELDMHIMTSKFKIDQASKLTDLQLARVKAYAEMNKIHADVERATELHALKMVDGAIRLALSMFKLL